MTDPTNAPPPEGQPPAAPEAPAVTDYGAPPEVIQEALNVYRDLNNLDTRHQRLSQMLRPDIDGQLLRQFVEPQQPEEQDPWAHLRGQEEYEDPYGNQYAPEPQGFDPRVLPDILDPVLQQREQQIEQRIFERLGQMAQQQAVTDAASQAVQSAGIPPEFSDMIKVQVETQMQLQPHRMPQDLAREAADNLKMRMSQWAAQPAASPAPSSAPPSGPVPAMDQMPKTFEEAAKMMQERLR